MKNKILILFLALMVFVVGLNTHVSAKENLFYIVQENDTMNKISKMFNIASNDIILHNKQLINTNFLIPNEYINIPNVDNNTFGVLYKQATTKINNLNYNNKSITVSNFNYNNSDITPTEYEISVLNYINETRKTHQRTPIKYVPELSLIAKNEIDTLLNKDIKKLQDSKNLIKKLSFYNVDYKYAGQLSLMGQNNPEQISELINEKALNDYIINPDYTKIGIYIFSLNQTLYTSIYFAC